MSETQAVFESWAVVELMGHVRMAGRVTEEERFGSKMGRIDIPNEVDCPHCAGTGTVMMGEPQQAAPCWGCGAKGKTGSFFTQYFGGASVYRVTPCSEEAARAVAARNQPEPVHQWELPKPALPTPTIREADEDYEEEDLCEICDGHHASGECMRDP